MLPENCKTNFCNALSEDLGSYRQCTFIKIAKLVCDMLLSAHFGTYYCILFCDIKQLLWLALELKVTSDIVKTEAVLFLLLLFLFFSFLLLCAQHLSEKIFHAHMNAFSVEISVRTDISQFYPLVEEKNSSAIVTDSSSA